MATAIAVNPDMAAPNPAPHLVCSAVAPSEAAVRFDPTWRTSTVLALAAGIAREGNFDAMPILADALEDAGCDNVLLLEHCRHATRHEPSCWALEVIRSDPPAEVNRPPEPQQSRPVLVEAARMMGEDLHTDGCVPASCIVLLTSLLTFAIVVAAIVSAKRGETLCLMLGAPFLAMYFVLCCKVIRNRRRRRNSQSPP